MTHHAEATLVASPQHIDVWLAYYHDIADPRLHQEYRSLLTEEERSKEFRFYFADDQRRYLVTRAMVRTVLSRYLHVRPTDWRFANNQLRAAGDCEPQPRRMRSVLQHFAYHRTDRAGRHSCAASWA